jgi:hypothetical protein
MYTREIAHAAKTKNISMERSAVPERGLSLNYLPC